jgi:hypothetical protein
MTAGASRAELTITRQPALAPSPQPRPAPTARALPLKHAVQRGQNWTPIGGQIWKPIDSQTSRHARHRPNNSVDRMELAPVSATRLHIRRAGQTVASDNHAYRKLQGVVRGTNIVAVAGLRNVRGVGFVNRGQAEPCHPGALNPSDVSVTAQMARITGGCAGEHLLVLFSVSAAPDSARKTVSLPNRRRTPGIGAVIGAG